jgi:hypothetical protein
VYTYIPYVCVHYIVNTPFVFSFSTNTVRWCVELYNDDELYPGDSILACLLFSTSDKMPVIPLFLFLFSTWDAEVLLLLLLLRKWHYHGYLQSEKKKKE